MILQEVFYSWYNTLLRLKGAAMQTRHFSLLKTTLVLLTFASTLNAHTDMALAEGFMSGFSHPIFGLDHVVAMVAVGLWGAFLGNPAIWILPIVFPLVMAFGGALGVIGMPLFAVETGIAISAIVLGLMVALSLRPPLWIAAIVVAAYSMGFVFSTGLLHLLGIFFGLLTKWPAGKIAIQTGGGFIALTGLSFLSGIL
jgi:urease accessory protein